LQAINLFAYRAVSPFEMMKSPRPVGPRNLAAIEAALANSTRVICAWGVHGRFMNQDRKFFRWLNQWPWIETMCLGVTGAGHPRHPLYLPYTAKLECFEVSPQRKQGLSPACAAGSQIG